MYDPTFIGPRLQVTEVSPELENLLAGRGFPVARANDAEVVRAFRIHVQRYIKGLPLPNGGPPPRIEVVVVERDGFGASCVLVDAAAHHYAIMLNEAAIVALCDTCNRALAHPDCFPEIGDPSRESFPPDCYGGIEERLKGSALGVVPSCEKRQYYAELLLRAGIRALGFHEYGHIVQGHLRLLQSGYNASLAQRHAMEIAADYYSSIKLAHWAKDIASQQPNRLYVEDELAVLDLAARATHIVHLHDEANAIRPVPQPGPRFHPLPPTRLIYSTYGLQLAYELINPGKTVSKKRLIAAVRGAEMAYRTISKAVIDHEYVKRTRSAVNDGDPLKVWQLQIRPHLEPLTYTVLMTSGDGPSHTYS